MKLTIITPTLNSLPRLEAASRSVVSQGASWVEHLIVDGGSTDGTLGWVRDFGHMKLLSGPDDGIFDAMNKGIAAASGDWIYFLGDDDKFKDDKVLSDLKPALYGNMDVVYGDVVSTRFGGRYDGEFDAKKILKKNICHQSIFFRRELFEKIGLFNQAYRSHADWDHNMRWLLNRTVRKKYIDRVIAVYADHGFSSVNPDPVFRRDLLYRYLTYGRGELSAQTYFALWARELASGVRRMDCPRIWRALGLPFES